MLRVRSGGKRVKEITDAAREAVNLLDKRLSKEDAKRIRELRDAVDNASSIINKFKAHVALEREANFVAAKVTQQSLGELYYADRDSGFERPKGFWKEIDPPEQIIGPEIEYLYQEHLTGHDVGYHVDPDSEPESTWTPR